MSQKELDCRGLPCPQPVLKCKQCLDQGLSGGLRVLVDNEPARENVTRLGSPAGSVVPGSEKTPRPDKLFSRNINGGGAVAPWRALSCCADGASSGVRAGRFAVSPSMPRMVRFKT